MGINAAYPVDGGLFYMTQPPIDLPWFYCMIATQRRAADDSGWKLFEYEPVAFDPDCDKWLHLPIPLQPFTSVDGAKSEPICSVGSLVCWEHIA
ncbi:hypothetical protein GOP47_0016391 [Adiantum capillus-veneris]|uniref:Uncharacterized protein n=1 Tax=Adiantum capillus-veneris TaxID=13818 RepID=A0A9D4UHK2_ADICA|nr:hypothetical protein GOP47_0016391 [Adiantum capillus-veneris]